MALRWQGSRRHLVTLKHVCLLKKYTIYLHNKISHPILHNTKRKPNITKLLKSNNATPNNGHIIEHTVCMEFEPVSLFPWQRLFQGISSRILSHLSSSLNQEPLLYFGWYFRSYHPSGSFGWSTSNHCRTFRASYLVGQGKVKMAGEIGKEKLEGKHVKVLYLFFLIKSRRASKKNMAKDLYVGFVFKRTKRTLDLLPTDWPIVQWISFLPNRNHTIVQLFGTGALRSPRFLTNFSRLIFPCLVLTFSPPH